MKFYIISPPKENLNFSPKNLDLISEIIPIEFFQFRPKHRFLEKKLDFVKKYYYEIKQICLKKKIKMIINDDFEIAKKFVFDGIHLGQNDRKCQDAKKEFGASYLVGISCSNSMDFYHKAKKNGADYVAFGPAFKSKNKKKQIINIKNLIEQRNKISLPFTLIGGINHKNVCKLKILKPNNVAIIDSMWSFECGPIESARLYKKLIDKDKSYEN